MVYFRVDANNEIAFGHVMRCLSLADEFHAAGKPVCFVLADDNARGVVENRGYEAVVLGTDWRDLSGEVEAVRDMLAAERPSLLLVDTYRVTAAYVESLSDVARVCYLGSKPGYLGSLFALVNYSTDVDELAYRELYGDVGTMLLLGPSFAPLRSEFQGRDIRPRASVSRILVTTGSTDPNDMVGAILDAALDDLRLFGLTFDVVVGPRFAYRDALFGRFGRDSRVVLHEGVDSMSSLMDSCDLALSANGTTVYELAAMGLPAVTFAMVPEQEASGSTLGSLGALRYCGLSQGNEAGCARRCTDELATLASDSAVRGKLARRAHEIVDGNGCQRIVRRLLG